jgi:hypothetical protein
MKGNRENAYQMAINEVEIQFLVNIRRCSDEF